MGEGTGLGKGHPWCGDLIWQARSGVRAGTGKVEGWVLVGGCQQSNWEKGRLVETKLGPGKASWGQEELLVGFLGLNINHCLGKYSHGWAGGG